MLQQQYIRYLGLFFVQWEEVEACPLILTCCLVQKCVIKKYFFIFIINYSFSFNLYPYLKL